MKQRLLRRARTLIDGFLTSPAILRVSVDLGAGSGIAFGVGGWRGGAAQADPFWLRILVFIIAGAAIGTTVGVIIEGYLRIVRPLVVLAAQIPEPGRLAALPWVVVPVSLLIWLISLEPVNLFSAWCLLVCAGWLGMLVGRRLRSGEHRLPQVLTDVLVAALTGLDLVVLFDRGMLAPLPAAGLLFPVAVWLGMRIWRVLLGSAWFAVRAVADIVLSLWLGTTLVLFLVWSTNLLQLPTWEVAALRGALEQVGFLTELPWWVWMTVYGVLAVLSLAIAAWPARLATVGRWTRRSHLVPSVNVSRRALTVVHIGLMVGVLIGTAGPAVLNKPTSDALRMRYTVAIQREIEERGEIAAYTEIRHRFSSVSPGYVRPLATVLAKAHSIASQASGPGEKATTEADLSRRIGRTQAATLDLRSPPAARETIAFARFEGPVRDRADLDDRIRVLGAEQRTDDATQEHVEQAAEAAAIVVAGLIQIPQLGGNEIVQVVKEYLGGLIESSPLKKFFAATAMRFTKNTDRPATTQIVVPDPFRLRTTAALALIHQHVTFQVGILTSESTAQGATDLINIKRYIDQGTGPCEHCGQPQHPGQEPGEGPLEHPVEPEIHVR